MENQSRQLAWSAFGKPLENATTSAEALEQAGLLWNVAQSPVQWTTADGTLHTNDTQLCNYRDDTGALLGVVSKRYQVVQNAEAFAFMDCLTEEGVQSERVGVAKGGRLVWLLAKMPEQRILQDAYAPYLLITNGHDGGSPVNVCMTPIRVACSNTVNLAISKASHRWSFSHTLNVMHRMDEAKQTLGFAKSYMTRLGEVAEELVAQKLSETAFRSCLEKLFPKKGIDTPGKRTQDNIDRFMQCYTESDLDNVRGTAYGFLMAVADFTSHAPLRATDLEKARERHFLKTVVQPSWLLTTALGMFSV